jgi:hypothetical protein
VPTDARQASPGGFLASQSLDPSLWLGEKSKFGRNPLIYGVSGGCAEAQYDDTNESESLLVQSKLIDQEARSVENRREGQVCT